MKTPHVMVNIGNTRTSVALGDGSRIWRVGYVPTHSQTMRTIRQALRVASGGGRVEGAILCSVVPEVTEGWRKVLRDAAGSRPLVVTHRLEIGLAVDYPRPETLGADRLANVCAAASQYATPLIVADFGTAATFDVVTKDRRYVGGVIAAGPGVMCDYLGERTARLPAIRFQASRIRIGKNTREAMRIGAYVGYGGLVRGIVEHLMDAPGLRKANLVATGGFAGVVATGTGLAFRVCPVLTLQGLSRIWAMNRR